MTEPTAELVHLPAGRVTELSMLRPSTDSWTAVLEDVADLANKIARTDFVPESHRGNVGQVAAVILHGRELGLPPMTALTSTHVIKGKPSISAEAMRALILQAGHRIVITESTSARCTIQGRRAEVTAADGVVDAEVWTTVTWTMDDARQAGLLSNHNYKTYPRQMLAARATAELARLIFPDVIHGMRAIEEMDDVTPWEGPSTSVEQTAAPATTKVRRQTRKQAEIAPAEPAAEQQPDQPPAAEQAAPERRRPDLPTRGRRPAEDGPPASAQPETHDSPAPASEAGAVAPTPVSDPHPAASSDAPSPAPEPAPDVEAGGSEGKSAPSASAPSVEEQQADLRQLAEQRRQQTGRTTAAPAEPVDAEVIDTADRRGITPSQRGFLMAEFKRLGIDDRQMRLTYSMALTGRDDLQSSNQLTLRQASNLIEQLQMCATVDELEARVNGQDSLT